ncbi:hypothetical protein Bca4012_084031 [Brassica carinata]
MKQGDSSVREYNSSFLAAGLLDNHDQRMLVKMYRDSLKEDIRVALGSTEFSTIDDIMQAALDIEEGARSSSSDSEKLPKKKPRTEMQPEDGHSGEEPYGDKDTSKMKQFDSSVREYNASFAAAGLTNNPDQGMLVKMYRDGLKEDIQVVLGSTEFSTIEHIMQAAIEIEEEKRQKKKPQTEFEPEDEQPDEDPYGDKDETDDGEGSTPNTRNESESESYSAVDLRDYQEYL